VNIFLEMDAQVICFVNRAVQEYELINKLRTDGIVRLVTTTHTGSEDDM